MQAASRRATRPRATSVSSSLRDDPPAPGNDEAAHDAASRRAPRGTPANGRLGKHRATGPRSPSRSADPACPSRSAPSPRRTTSAGTAPVTSMPPSLKTSTISGSISSNTSACGRERDLDVDLRELGLPIGAQILVAEAADDLEVAIDARDHQDLLEDLRRLRQREELARMHAARHEIVARALGRRLGQDRRLDLEEALRRRNTAGSPSSACGAGSGSAACAAGADRDSDSAAACPRRPARRRRWRTAAASRR